MIKARCQRVGWGERAVALLLLLWLLPLLLLLALLVRLSDGRPVLFRQRRRGYRGQPFTLYKFRTMELHAELQQADLQERYVPAGELFALAGDPRLIAGGSFLRRTFLDELPQLFNVLRGEMRLVGPRPLPLCDDRLYTLPQQRLRLEGMPGMTGVWQVGGRHALNFAQMCACDGRYLHESSWWLDVRILLATVVLILRHLGGGAAPVESRQL